MKTFTYCFLFFLISLVQAQKIDTISLKELSSHSFDLQQIGNPDNYIVVDENTTMFLSSDSVYHSFEGDGFDVAFEDAYYKEDTVSYLSMENAETDTLHIIEGTFYDNLPYLNRVFFLNNEGGLLYSFEFFTDEGLPLILTAPEMGYFEGELCVFTCYNKKGVHQGCQRRYYVINQGTVLNTNDNELESHLFRVQESQIIFSEQLSWELRDLNGQSIQYGNSESIYVKESGFYLLTLIDVNGVPTVQKVFVP